MRVKTDIDIGLIIINAIITTKTADCTRILQYGIDYYRGYRRAGNIN